MCADPHIQHNAPGVLYLFHLKTPGVDVIGAGFPGVPVVVYGHNGYCGWSATSLCADTQDLYLIKFESESSDRYLFDGQFLEPEVIEEKVKVRFSGARTLRILVARHGPVIKRKGDRGLALKWLTHSASMDSLGALLKQNRASTWEEFTSSMKSFVGPAMNQVYADTDGNIGYLAAARIPQRQKGDGTIPYDGADPECEWDGIVDFERMPKSLNPEDGFIVTANSKAVSEGYPLLIRKAWESPYRNGRISELIGSRERWSVDEMRIITGMPLRDLEKGSPNSR